MIFQPECGGHRLHHVKLLLQALAALTPDVHVVLGRDAPGSKEYRTHLSGLDGAATYHAVVDPDAIRGRGVVGGSRAALRALRQAVDRVRPDHVYVPTGDGLAQVAGAARLVGRRYVPRGVEVETLLFRGRVGYPSAGLRNRLIDWATLRATQLTPWDRIFFGDAVRYQAVVGRSGRSVAARMRLTPDPVEEVPDMGRAEARRVLGLPSDGRYVACMGRIDTRKGCDLLVKAFAAADLRPDDRLLLLGKVDPPVADVLRSPGVSGLIDSGRIVVHDDYVSDEQMLAGFSAADVVCTPYPRHLASASIVIRAAAARRPVLGSDTGWMGDTVPRFGLGWTCDVEDVPTFARAMREAVNQSEGFSFGESSKRFVAFHSVRNFAACWTERVRERLGLPSEEGRLTWEWVLAGRQAAPVTGGA